MEVIGTPLDPDEHSPLRRVSATADLADATRTRREWATNVEDRQACVLAEACTGSDSLEFDADRIATEGATNATRGAVVEGSRTTGNRRWFAPTRPDEVHELGIAIGTGEDDDLRVNRCRDRGPITVNPRDAAARGGGLCRARHERNAGPTGKHGTIHAGEPSAPRYRYSRTDPVGGVTGSRDGGRRARHTVGMGAH